MDGPAEIRAVRASWRRGQIVAAATRLLEDRGFHAVSVNDVAKAAGISVGTVYQYLKNKEDILLVVLTDILEEYGRRLPGVIEKQDKPVDQLIEGFREYCRIVDERHSAASLAYRESKTLTSEGLERITALERTAIEMIEQCIRDAQDDGTLVPGVDSSLLAIDLVMLAHMWALKRWYLKDRFATVEEYADAQLHMMFSSIVLNGRQLHQLDGATMD